MIQEETRPFASVLEALLTDENVPIHLLYRLSDLAPEEWERFTSRWSQVPEERRRVIVRHMADISEENFVVDFSPVFAHCFQDMAAAVRVAALDGLWDATDTTLIRPIIDLMRTDESVEVRAAAAAALAHYVLMAEWGELPRHISPPIVEALLTEYEKPDVPLPIKRAALEALGAANHPRVAVLIKEAYESYDPGLQLSAIFAMGNSADPYWLPTVLAEMTNPSAEMRAEAARAAGTIGRSDAISALADLAIDEDLEVSLTAVKSLGQIGGDLAHEILAELVADPEFEHLHEAVEEAIDELTWLSGELSLLTVPDGDEPLEDDGLWDFEE